MANRAVKQPNGLYARFSDVMDHFTNENCRREDLWCIFRDLYGTQIAYDKMGCADAELHRFDEAIDIIRRVHGDLEADAVRKKLSEAGNV